MINLWYDFQTMNIGQSAVSEKLKKQIVQWVLLHLEL
jgi:hypothetical protein